MNRGLFLVHAWSSLWVSAVRAGLYRSIILIYKSDPSRADQSHPWAPLSRMELVNGAPTLRYMRADPASAAACVSCHNSYEQVSATIAMREESGTDPGKHWEMNELMGAIQVDIPLHTVEAAAADIRTGLLTSIGLALGFGFRLLIGILYGAVIRPTERSIREVDSFQECVDSVVDTARHLLDGAEIQLDTIDTTGAQMDAQRIRELAVSNASNAELAAASCGELQGRFQRLNGELQKMLGHK